MEEKNKADEGLHDPARAAYMIAWRDRHIEKQKEMIAGYEEQHKLMEALLAFALLKGAVQKEASLVAEISKEELSLLLGCYESVVEGEEDRFVIRFTPIQEPQDGGEEDGAH